MSITAVLHSTYSRAEGYGIIGDKEKFRAIVDAFHRNGVKVLVYYGYEYPTIMPGWSKKKDDYLIRHPGGKWVGGWQAETHRASVYRDAARTTAAVSMAMGTDPELGVARGLPQNIQIICGCIRKLFML